MDEFERQIANALQRQDPPAWFEARVLAAEARARDERHGGGWNWRRAWAGAACAAVLLASGVVMERQRAMREQEAGRAAVAKLEMALKVTRTTLQRIDERIAPVQQ